jgi:hypothetical protein
MMSAIAGKNLRRKQRNAGLFEVLIGQFAEDREIDIVVRKC